MAAGVTQSYFGHDEFAFFAPGMKTLDDAAELRRRIFGAFEMAEMVADPAEKKRWLTVVVVGAGPTGVELAGQVRELATRSLRGEFRTFEASSVRVILVDGGNEPLATFGDQLSGKAAKTLEHLGVELRMGAPGGRHRRRRGRRQGSRWHHQHRGPDHHLGRRGPGLPAGQAAGRRLAAPSIDRAGRIAVLPDLTPPRPSRGVRRRGHGHPRQAARRGRSGHAGWAPRRQHHSPSS